MYYYNNFEEIESTGNTIRRKNKMKAQNLMNVALSFNDDATLEKIQELFLSMSPEEMMAFKQYLDDRQYIKGKNSKAPEQAVINKIVRIAVSSVPKDSKLKEIYNEYNKNLAMIDQLKVKTTETTDCKLLNKIMEQINNLSEKNVGLLEMVNGHNS